MAKITIPREIKTKKDLIAVPKDIYKEFLVWQKAIKSSRVFKPTATEKKALSRARKNFKQGNYHSLEKLRNELESNN